jgi:hypothetical protein
VAKIDENPKRTVYTRRRPDGRKDIVVRRKGKKQPPGIILGNAKKAGITLK